MKSATVALGDYIEQVRGISYKPDEISDKLLPDFIPILRAGNFDENGLNFNDLVYIHKSKVKDEQLIRKGDILLAASSGSKDIVGKNVQFKDDYKGTFGAFCKVVRPKKYFIAEFVGKFFRTPYYRNVIRKSIQGANINNLRSEHIDDLRIPFLEVAEQRRIADLLSKAELLIAKRKESIALLDEYLKSVFLEMFGEANKSAFPVQKLNDVSKKITDGEHGTVARLENGKLYLMARNITVNNSIDLSEVAYISEEDHNKIFKRCNPETGDLMMVCVGATIGKVVLVPENMEPFSLARSVALIKPDRNKVISQYLLWFFNSESGKRQIKNNTNESAQGGLYTGKLREINIPVPPLKLQNQFAQLVAKVETLKSHCGKSLIELDNIYRVLTQKVFDSRESKQSNEKAIRI